MTLFDGWVRESGDDKMDVCVCVSIGLVELRDCAHWILINQ